MLDRGWLSEVLGSSVIRSGGVGGGSINEAHRVDLADGRRVFVKTNADPPAGMFAAEAEGLAWLAEGAGEELRLPAILAVDEHALVLEWIEPDDPARHAERLGRGLARLHRSAAGLAWGLGQENFIARLPQRNATRTSWPDFYREQRLEPWLDHVPSLRARFDRLFAVLDDRCGPCEPARLHGDLWSGNVIADARGPVLIDPAVYVGHREIDLAMLRLFGGMPERTFDAYAEVWPLDPGWRERVPLWQLYPLLIHRVLFGAAYEGSLAGSLWALGV